MSFGPGMTVKKRLSSSAIFSALHLPGSITKEIKKMTGKIKFFNSERGFGFISQPDGKDIFFHVSNIKCVPSDIKQGEKVTFKVEEGEKGLQAIDVILENDE